MCVMFGLGWCVDGLVVVAFYEKCGYVKKENEMVSSSSRPPGQQANPFLIGQVQRTSWLS